MSNIHLGLRNLLYGAIVLLFCGTARTEMVIETAGVKVSPFFENFLKETQAGLPELFVRHLPRFRVQHRSAPLSGNPMACVPAGQVQLLPRIFTSSSEKIFEIKGKELIVHQEAMDFLEQNDNRLPSPCFSLSLRELYQIELIRELAQAFDSLGLHLGLDRESEKQCSQFFSKGEHRSLDRSDLENFCLSVRQKRKSISDSIIFKNSFGWEKLGLFNSQRVFANTRGHGLPYEALSPGHTFSNRLALMLVDKDFSCRWPTNYDYFYGIFGDPIKNSRDCKISYEVQSQHHETGGLGKTLSLDPERLYEVQLVLAKSGKTLESSFGHMFLRLVYCAPNRPLGPNCRLDLDHHSSLSFFALPDNISGYSKWDGFTGVYPSYLTMTSFQNTKLQYTDLEDRDLVVLPFKISREKTRLFALKVLETYWNFQGDYFFAGANCTSYAYSLIKSIFREDFLLQGSQVNTPQGAIESLIKLGYLEDKTIGNKNKKKAESEGYFFLSSSHFWESLQEDFNASLRLSNLGLSSFQGPKSYISKNSPGSILEALEKFDLGVCTRINCVRFLSRLILLEEHRRLMLTSAGASFLGRLSKDWDRFADCLSPELDLEVKKYISLAEGAIDPRKIASARNQSSYGIPIFDKEKILVEESKAELDMSQVREHFLPRINHTYIKSKEITAKLRFLLARAVSP